MTGSGAIRWEISRNMLQPALGRGGLGLAGGKVGAADVKRKKGEKKSL